MDSLSKALSYRYSDMNFGKKRGGTKATFQALETVLAKAVALDSPQSSLDGEARDGGGQKRGRDIARISTIQFFDALCLAIGKESTVLNFDYVALHIRCSKLLQEVRRETREPIIDIYSKPDGHHGLPPDFDTDDALRDVPMYILQIQADILLRAAELKLEVSDRIESRVIQYRGRGK